ncbi:SDR family NAD(P)-dependent oxidoreductase [Streptomyces sp. NPDC008092]|uniref:SDR family NAD(P)-dependent oxidoreductase n=1 Tax=Streptomyces sp. NPDC008092 TaxID=3364808 RepID=UPI0036EA181C
MSKTWIITGAGRGFGREFALAALNRGDRVAATARDTAALDDLVKQFGDAIVPLQLDVTDREQAFSVVQEAHSRLGRIDIVVNNAGYGLFGAVEEISVAQLRDQLEVNLFGVLNVTQAVLPVLREQGSGHIVQISTFGGVAAFPLLGGYHASKWALEGLTESLAQEVAGQGINVTLVEPGGFATDWAGNSAVWAETLSAYDPLRAEMAEQRDSLPAGMIGDPKAAGPALLKIVDAEQPPLRVFFGTFPTQLVPDLYKSRLDTWEAWKHVSLEANGDGATITSAQVAGH